MRRLLVGSVAWWLLALSGDAPAQQYTLDSVATDGTQGDLSSFAAGISAGGEYVAFWSNATTLVADDTNGVADIFVRHRVSGVTFRVSVSSTGEQGNGPSSQAAISADGRYVAFTSAASNLVAGDTNQVEDVFRHDLATGETIRISVATEGTQGNGLSRAASISADGRFIAFESTARNLVANDNSVWMDVFLRDCVNNHTRLLSVGPNGLQLQFTSQSPSISASGQWTSFSGYAGIPGSLGPQQIFVVDWFGSSSTIVSLAPNGVLADSLCRDSRISGDGNTIVFHTYATNLVAGDTNGLDDVFAHDRSTGVTSLVSVSSDGGPAGGSSEYATVSEDGRYVCFVSGAPNLVDVPQSAGSDVFLRDRQKGVTSLVSEVLDLNGPPGAAGAGVHWISPNGLHVAFTSSAPLVPFDTNKRDDVYVLGLPDPAPDTDGDGLLDDWEENGIPYTDTLGQSQRYMLPQADKHFKNLYVEVDRMPGVYFSQEAIDDVVLAFMNAPVSNPAGSGNGIHLIVEVDASEFVPFRNEADALCVIGLRLDHFGTVSERVDPGLIDAKAKAYRYCLVADGVTAFEEGMVESIPLNGLAIGAPCATFTVGLGALTEPLRTRRQFAKTFMHELGHALGLEHGGSLEADAAHPKDGPREINYKPNYVSVMNYNFSLFVDENFDELPLDYSREALLPIDESSIHESDSVQTSEYYGVCAPISIQTGPEVSQIRHVLLGVPPGNAWAGDWNGDGTTAKEPISADLNWYDGTEASLHGIYIDASPGQVMGGHNDWQALSYQVPPVEELTKQPMFCASTSVALVEYRAANPVLPPPEFRRCPGDANRDRVVNGADVSVLLSQFGEQVIRRSGADMNADGLVDGRDLSVLLANYGGECLTK